MSNTKSVKRNFLWQTMAQMLKILLPIITSPYLARTLGSEGTGIYSYTYSIVTYYTMFMLLGIENYGRRLVAKVRDDQKELNRVFSELIVTQILISSIVATVYFFYCFFWAKYRTIAIIQGLVILSIFLSIGWLYNGLEEIRTTALRFLVIKSACFILMFVCVKGEQALLNYTILMSASSLFSEILLWFRLWGKVQFSMPDIHSIKRHVPEILILFIPVALESVYNIMDKIMLGSLISVVEVGYYEYASKALIPRTIITSLGVVLLPRIASLYENKNYNKIWQYIEQSLKISLLFAIAIAFGIAAIASDFAPLFWGNEFIKCANIMQILSLTTIFWTVAQVIRTQYLIPTSHDREYIFSIFVGALVNVVLNFVFIPLYGGIGAAIGTLITEFVVCVFQVIVVRKELLAVMKLRSYIIYTVFGIMMYVTVTAIKMVLPATWLAVLMEIVIGAIVYIALCCCYWVIKKDAFYLTMINNALRCLKGKLKILR